MAIIGSEVVNHVVKGGFQVRRLTNGGEPGSAVAESPPDSWRQVREDVDQSGGLVTKVETVVASGTGAPPAGANRTVVESYYGQAKTGRG